MSIKFKPLPEPCIYTICTACKLSFNFALYCATLWRRQWQPTPVPLSGKSHGLRSLVIYSPWGRKESTERLHFNFHSIFKGFPGGTGEGNGTPLQYSCLENPMDGGAW